MAQAEMTRVRDFLRRLFGLEPPPHFRRLIGFPELPDVPDELEPDTVYIAGENLPKWAVLLCPCDKPHRVTLSLQRSSGAYWSVRTGRGGPTIYPSVDVRADLRGGVRCHYLVRGGRVRWVPEWEEHDVGRSQS